MSNLHLCGELCLQKGCEVFVIEVKITHKDDTGSRHLGLIKIYHLEDEPRPAPDDDVAGDYEIQLATGGWLDFTIARRGLRDFKRLKYSVFSLLLQALQEFTDNEELFHLDARRSRIVAREQHRAVPEIPPRKG